MTNVYVICPFPVTTAGHSALLMVSTARSSVETVSDALTSRLPSVTFAVFVMLPFVPSGAYAVTSAS